MFQSSSDGLVKLHHGLEAKVHLSPPAAVVVVGASQGHSHGGESGADGHQGAEQCAEELEDQGQEVDQPVGQVEAGSWVA